MNNKLKHNLKIIAIFIALLIIIISSASLWNIVAAGTTVVIGTFEIVVSIINFLLELTVLVYAGRKLLFED